VPARDRIPRYKPTRIPIPMDLTVCTRAELARELAAGNRFHLDELGTRRGALPTRRRAGATP